MSAKVQNEPLFQKGVVPLDTRPRRCPYSLPIPDILQKHLEMDEQHRLQSPEKEKKATESCSFRRETPSGRPSRPTSTFSTFSSTVPERRGRNILALSAFLELLITRPKRRRIRGVQALAKFLVSHLGLKPLVSGLVANK